MPVVDSSAAGGVEEVVIDESEANALAELIAEQRAAEQAAINAAVEAANAEVEAARLAAEEQALKEEEAAEAAAEAQAEVERLEDLLALFGDEADGRRRKLQETELSFDEVMALLEDANAEAEAAN